MSGNSHDKSTSNVEHAAASTHQQRREEERQNKLAAPVEHAGEGHGDGAARLVAQLGGDEPRDGAGAQLVGRDRSGN